MYKRQEQQTNKPQPKEKTLKRNVKQPVDYRCDLPRLPSEPEKRNITQPPLQPPLHVRATPYQPHPQHMK